MVSWGFERLVVEVRTPCWPLSGTASSTDFEARPRERVFLACCVEGLMPHGLKGERIPGSALLKALASGEYSRAIIVEVQSSISLTQRKKSTVTKIIG